MLVFMLDTENQKTIVKDIKDELEVFYDFIKCRCIDIPHRTIDGQPFAIICDDEGLFNPAPIPATLVTDSEGATTIDIVGNIIIAKDGKEGELEGLTPQDIELIKKNIWELENAVTGKRISTIHVDYN